MRGKYSQFIRNNKYTAYLTIPAPPHSLLSLSHLFLPHSAESGCQSQTITRIVRRAQTSCSMVSWCLPCSSSAGARQHSSLSLSHSERINRRPGGQEEAGGGGGRGRVQWRDWAGQLTCEEAERPLVATPSPGQRVLRLRDWSQLESQFRGWWRADIRSYTNIDTTPHHTTSSPHHQHTTPASQIPTNTTDTTTYSFHN